MNDISVMDELERVKQLLHVEADGGFREVGLVTQMLKQRHAVDAEKETMMPSEARSNCKADRRNAIQYFQLI